MGKGKRIGRRRAAAAALLSAPRLLRAYDGASPRPTERLRRRRLSPSSFSSSSSSCIQFWHRAPDEPDTCTNSGDYPPEWARAPAVDFMFHRSAEDCCAELRRPWSDWAEAGWSAGGGVPACHVVDTCRRGGGDEDGDGEDVPPPVAFGASGTALGNGDDPPPPCDGQSKKQCAKASRCRYDPGRDACVAWSPPAEVAAGVCEGRPRKPCVKDASCAFDAVANTCRDAILPLSAGAEIGNSSSSSSNSDNSSNPADVCDRKMYHPVSVVERRCANDAAYPVAWNATPTKYFFADGAACCAAFYAGGPCEVTDVCDEAWDDGCCCGLSRKRCAKEGRCALGAAGACVGRGGSENDGGAAPDARAEPVAPPSPPTASPSAAADCRGQNKKRCAKDARCAYDREEEACRDAGDSADNSILRAPPGVTAMASPAATPVCFGEWYESTEALYTCTNSRHTPITGRAFASGQQCCEIRFSGKPCKAADACFRSEAPTTPLPTSLMPTLSPTYMPTTVMPTSVPTTTMPTAMPTSPRPTRLAADGSAIDPACLDREWHLSRVPRSGEGEGCTNDGQHPAAWAHPAMRAHFLFATAVECCAANFGVPSCLLHDICVEAASPTDMPSTSWPTSRPWPTFGPTATFPEATETACDNLWHPAEATKRTCTNNSKFPKSWSLPSRRKFFLFDSARECCEKVFPEEKCVLVNVCPIGRPGAKPTRLATKEPTMKPTNKPSNRPMIDASWFVDNKNGQCVQDCVGPMPCGGKRPNWEKEYDSPHSCCKHMFWKTFEECAATPSPTTSSPTEHPTMSSPTEHPTTSSPTEHPTSRPTKYLVHAPMPAAPVSSWGCSAQNPWHMSTRPGDIQTCTNSGEVPLDWLNTAHLFLHATSEICCQKVFGGDPSCQVNDICAKLNQGTKDEAQGSKTDEDSPGGKGQGSELENPTELNSDGEDDFEGGGTLPWMLGNPPEWEIDEHQSFSGDRSIRNIPSSEVSVTRTLRLYTNLPVASTLSCKLKVDISMPFDRFALYVNGATRKDYYGPEDDWVALTTGLAKGRNAIEFTVINADMFPPFESLTSGRVWLDACFVKTL